MARNARAKAYRHDRTFRAGSVYRLPTRVLNLMDELFACTNSCVLARFYTTTTAHTLSGCFANFMREKLSPSWPGINPLSLCTVCRQWPFINYLLFLRLLVRQRVEKRRSMTLSFFIYLFVYLSISLSF